MFTLSDVYLAALFHDIGKFYQRACPEEKNKVLEKQKGIRDYLNLQGVPHQLWSCEFVETIPFLKNRKRVIEGIIHHHRSDEHFPIGLLVSIADRVSASERIDYNSQEEEDKVETKQLEAVMSRISFGEKKGKKWYKNIQKLSQLERNSFPNGQQLTDEEETKKYKKLWEEFYDDIFDETIEDSDDIDAYERIYYILKEYTSNIPSAFYYSHPDISLFSHLSTTAAIASALYVQYEEEIKKNDFSFLNDLKKDLFTNSTERKVLGIIKGDLSGIQDFIYNIPYDHALKKLKGRSFYLDFLIYIIGKWILRKEGLPIANLIMSGGGHFYALVPARSIEKVSEYQREIDNIIYKAHGTELSVILSGIQVSLVEMSNFSEVLRKLGELSEEKKSKKMESLINSEEFYRPLHVNSESCPYCHRQTKQVEDENEKCEFCESFAELGSQLAKNKYLLLEKVQERKKPSIRSVEDVFEQFGYKLIFRNEPHKMAYMVEKNEPLNLDKCMHYIVPATYMSKTEDGNLVELDEMAQRADGINRWGILRGDVDNLGKIFREGLGDEKSLAKVSTLSEEFKLFFGYYLESLVSKEFAYCSVVYSGGDDFLIIGPWSVLPHLAKRLRTDFEKFVCENGDITVSMAIAIAKDVKFPIYRVAEAAGENLDEAKKYKREQSGKTKNAVNFMDEIIGWEEWETFEEVAGILKEIVKRSKKRVVLNYMYEVSRLSEKAEKEKDYVKSWRLVYKVSQFKNSYRMETGIPELSEKLLDKILLKSENKIYKNIFGCARWVEFTTRKDRTEGGI